MDQQKLLLRISAIVSAISGVIILFSVIYPIISYESVAARKYPSLLSPVATKKTTTGSSLGTSNDPNTNSAIPSSTDFTKPENWFVGSDYKIGNPTGISYYTISIPRLDIKDAVIEVGGSDLGKSLIHYPGTALPGKPGNAVIFGHSILPQFYNPKSYLAIFSLLPTLDVGDEVQLNFDGVTYNYTVETMFEVTPTDLQVLDQQTDASHLTLVTCVPPGHPLRPKRLIVRAKIASYNKGLAPAVQ